MKRVLSPMLSYSKKGSPDGRFSVKSGNMRVSRSYFWGAAIVSTRLLRRDRFREDIFGSCTLALSGSCRETEPIMHCGIISVVVVSSSNFVSAFRTSILAASGAWLWLLVSFTTLSQYTWILDEQVPLFHISNTWYLVILYLLDRQND